MAKETQKAKIERLERELEELKQQRNSAWEEIEKVVKKYNEIQEAKEDAFKQTVLYKQMEKKIKDLEGTVKQKSGYIKTLEELRYSQAERIEQLQKMQKQLPTHNERGAGRKQRFNGAEIEQIKLMRARGETIKAIAEYMECSVGLIHKLISEQ